MPIGEQLGYIYCALVQILNNGGGGTVNIEDVEGVSDFWKATLSGTPAANQVFGTDGAGVFTTLPYSDGGAALLNIETPGSSSFIILSDLNVAGFQAVGVNTIQNPVTEIMVENGIVVGAS